MRFLGKEATLCRGNNMGLRISQIRDLAYHISGVLMRVGALKYFDLRIPLLLKNYYNLCELYLLLL